MVEEFREVVDVNPTRAALVVVVDSGRRIEGSTDSAVLNGGGLGESEASGEAMVGRGISGWKSTEVEEEEDLDEEDDDENPCSRILD